MAEISDIKTKLAQAGTFAQTDELAATAQGLKDTARAADTDENKNKMDDTTGGDALDADDIDDYDDDMEDDSALKGDSDAGDEAEVDAADDDGDDEDDEDDSEDASKMPWPCQECGCGTKSSPAVPCEGRLCLLIPERNVYVRDARALCYTCAGVTRDTVDAAPPFFCHRCVDAV